MIRSKAAGLPPLYARWFDDFLDLPLEEETEATCDDCAMCRSSPVLGAPPNYAPNVKCCSFWPTLPNFVVGRILQDSGTGPDRVAGRLTDQVGVTPLGIGPSPAYQALYAKLQPASFGRSVALRCPYYVDEGSGSCSIWRHRESVCTTFFCKVVRGAAGNGMWQAAKSTLARLERSLIWWCVEQLNPGHAAVEALLAERPAGLEATDLTGKPVSHYGRLWGTWAGRERAWFEACGRLVENLSAEEVLHIGGPEAILHLQCLKARQAALAERRLPALVRVGQFTVQYVDGETMQIMTYSPQDGLTLQADLVRLLPAFNVAPLAAVRRQAAQQGVALSLALLRNLLDYQILLPR
ncbi:MAG TPA: hypothetical protein VGO93_20360 [Candidatus Xenobia bacterium]|jgi:Fe-S-cluster containining protein